MSNTFQLCSTDFSREGENFSKRGFAASSYGPACVVRTYVKLSLALQHTKVIAEFRVSIIRSTQPVRNECTTSCTHVCMQRCVELTAPVTDI